MSHTLIVAFGLAMTASSTLICPREPGRSGAIAEAFVPTASSPVRSEALIDELNATLPKVDADKCSWRPVLEAWAAATAPPCSADSGCGEDRIWPGMNDWSRFSAWSASQQGIAKAIREAQFDSTWGMPYGEKALPAGLRAKGVAVTLGEDDQFGNLRFGYFEALRTIGQFVTSEQYRLCEQGKFAEGFGLGVAYLRVLRQVCDQSLLAEKLFAMRQLDVALSVQRDALWRYRDRLPAKLAIDLAKDMYPVLGVGDGATMRRIQLPEADLLVIKSRLARAFDDSGNADAERFAKVFGADVSRSSPMQRFGEEKLWARLAAVHASYDESVKRLQAIYDDWYRRWRIRPYGSPFDGVPTQLSVMNPVRYAAVDKLLKDMQSVFDAKKLLIANANGTCYAAALVARFRADGAWPEREEVATNGDYLARRVNLDPFNRAYDADRKAGNGFMFDFARKVKFTDAPVGRINVEGPFVYSIGMDHESNNAATHTDDGSKGDILIWPPVRELAREQGLLGS